jgi:hypothetical protein
MQKQLAAFALNEWFTSGNHEPNLSQAQLSLSLGGSPRAFFFFIQTYLPQHASPPLLAAYNTHAAFEICSG